jgi:hypothetical protein
VASLYWTVDGDGRPVVLLHAGGLDSRIASVSWDRRETLDEDERRACS